MNLACLESHASIIGYLWHESRTGAWTMTVMPPKWYDIGMIVFFIPQSCSWGTRDACLLLPYVACQLIAFGRGCSFKLVHTFSNTTSAILTEKLYVQFHVLIYVIARSMINVSLIKILLAYAGSVELTSSRFRRTWLSKLLWRWVAYAQLYAFLHINIWQVVKL